MFQANLDAIQSAAQELENALAGHCPGHEQEWSVRMRDVLLDVEQALRVHRASTEGQNGMFASMNDLAPDTTPTRDRQLQKFCAEHEDFMERARILRSDVQQAERVFQPREDKPPTTLGPVTPVQAGGAVPDFGSIRQRGAHLVEALRKHKEDETKLLLETATTDVGVGD
jgi:hypothetical protein